TSDRDGIFFVGVAPEAKAARLAWELVSRQDAEFGEAAHRMAAGPVVGFAPSVSLVPDTEDSSLEILGVHGGPVALAELVPALDRLLELQDLPLDALEEVAHPAGKRFEGAAEDRIFGETRGSQKVLPPGFESYGHSVVKSCAEPLQQGIDLLLIE